MNSPPDRRCAGRPARSVSVLVLALLLGSCDPSSATPAAGSGGSTGTRASAPPAGAAVTLVRCAPSLDPLAVVGGSRRFLGGRFAVAVPGGLPVGADPVGSTEERTLFLEPGPQGRLFALEHGATSRWLELPTLRPSADAYVLGDSIALGSARDLVAELGGWSITLDAVVGRPSGAGVGVAAILGSGGIPFSPSPVPTGTTGFASPAGAWRPPSAVVVELGTNDDDAATFADNAREILRSLADEPLVVWVAPHRPSEVTAEVRRELEHVVADTRNAVVADWDAAVPEDALSSDGIHLLPERTGVFAEFLAPYLRSWRLAADGEGAASCLR